MKIRPLIWIEGLLGSGKSSLAEKMGQHFGMRVMREPVETNPYLEDFYKDPKKHAFAMQIHLLGIREGMQALASHEVLFGEQYQGVILDRGLSGDFCFARLHTKYGNMSPTNYETYQMLYKRHTNGLKPPTMMIFLDVEPEVALRRVRERARGAEVNIDLQYLQDLRDQYLDLLVELQNGEHDWCGKVEIKRLAWNADHTPTDALFTFLQDRFHLHARQDPGAAQATKTGPGSESS